MDIVSFSPKDLISVGDSLKELNSCSNDIKTSISNLKKVNFSYSPSTSSNVSSISSKVDEMLLRVSNLNASYKSSSELLLDFLKQNDEQVSSLDKDGVIEYSDQSINEVIDFYLNYPEASEKIRPITEDELRSIFEQNGAKCFFNNKYEFEVDGQVYRYNVKSPYTIECSSDDRKIMCNFFISTNTSFEDIKNTITVLCGTGTNSVPDALKNMSVNPDTIVAVGYGNDSAPNIPHVTSGITRACNYLAGHTESGSLNNSIVGYSLGGVSAFRAASNNPGLYKRIVTVNSASIALDYSRDFIDDYNVLKDVEIIMVEAKGDKFEGQATETIKRLKEHGAANVSFYTNSSSMRDGVSKYLDDNHVHTVPDDFADSHVGWNGHNNGFNMLVDINIFSYLS